MTGLVLYQGGGLIELPAAIGELMALTSLNLYECYSLEALPDAIGKLGALTELKLEGCSKLKTLPETIGNIDALKMLCLAGCSSLEKLPDAINGRAGLTVELPSHLVSGPLAGDFAVLRKLREDYASVERVDDSRLALKKYFESEDPDEWKNRNGDGDKIVTMKDGRVTKLSVCKCSTLTALPAVIGEL